ncbi:hypothetical protein GIB67_015203 [Kingdonia uniflora]|uniref:RRM domain-containing protein n=1 Tax=Kingdonia uniflora TaxID=39325 RepID=A0A7J7MST0_9MAGN|nr:hypothetical protein GIB67_015203 [Kingdonia uniflora]
MVSVKLSSANFLLWQSQILPFLESQELLGYIDGAITNPSLTISNEEGSSEENPEYRKWRLADRFVTSLINSSLTEEAMSKTMGTSTSRELWTALEESFSSKSTTQELHLSEELQSLKQGSYSISNHAKRFKKICDQLVAIGTLVPDHKKDDAQNTIRRLNRMLINDKKVYAGFFVLRQERDRANGSPKFTNLYIKNISETTTDEDLKKVVGNYGPVTSAVVMKDANGGFRDFGFVNFKNSDDTASVVEKFNGT